MRGDSFAVLWAMPVPRGLLLLSYRWILPPLLVSSALFRSTFAAFGYLLFFMGMLLVRPSVYRPRSGRKVRVYWLVI
jgi:hypothetical protein